MRPLEYQRATHGRSNPYERPTFPTAAADFWISSRGRATIPQRNAILNIPEADDIGRMEGEVVILAHGLQTVAQQPGELSQITLFASPGEDQPLQHFAFHHSLRAGEEPFTSIVQGCPGTQLELNCGCAAHRDQAVNAVYKAKTGLLFSLDRQTQPQETQQIVANIADLLGVGSLNKPLSPSGCTLRGVTARLPEKPLRVLQDGNGGSIFLTHSLPVTLKDSTLPAHLEILHQPAKAEVRGYNGRGQTYYVLKIGDIDAIPPVARIHSACTTADHGSNACDCHYQREETFKAMRRHGSGLFIEACDHDGMGLGTAAKLFQTELTLAGEVDLLTAREKELAIPADTRSFGILNAVRELTGIGQIILASNNRQKAGAFERAGFEIVGSWPLPSNRANLAPQAWKDILAKNGSGRYNSY